MPTSINGENVDLDAWRSVLGESTSGRPAPASCS